MIRLAAAKPHDRMTFLTEEGRGEDSSLIRIIKNDAAAKAFGINEIDNEPMMVKARILPQAKLLYADGLQQDPELKASTAL